jgi:Zn-finger nucleic acid-binding protein
MRKSASLDTSLIIDHCRDCHGLWFDGGEVRGFLNSDSFKERFLDAPAPEGAPAAQPDPQYGRVCPKCQRALEHLELQSVEVDICVGCMGVWLDAGELDQLISAGKQHSLDDDDSLLAHEIREGLNGEDIPSHLIGHVGNALKNLLSRR